MGKTFYLLVFLLILACNVANGDDVGTKEPNMDLEQENFNQQDVKERRGMSGGGNSAGDAGDAGDTGDDGDAGGSSDPSANKRRERRREMTEDDGEKVEDKDETAPKEGEEEAPKKEEEEEPKEGEEESPKEGEEEAPKKEEEEEPKEGEETAPKEGEEEAQKKEEEEEPKEGKEEASKEGKDEGDVANVKTTTEKASDGKTFTTYGIGSLGKNANAPTNKEGEEMKSKVEIKEESDSADNFYQDTIADSVELWAMIDPSLHNLVLTTQIIPGQIKYIYDLFEDGLALIDDKVFLTWAHRQLIVIKAYQYLKEQEKWLDATSQAWPDVHGEDKETPAQKTEM